MSPVIKRVDPFAQDEALYSLRHSAAHLMAEAVIDLFGDVKLGIGPPIKDGFYYDFLMPHRFTEDDLPKIEEKMRELAFRNQKFERYVLPRKDAEKQLAKEKEELKLDLLKDIPENEEISFYKSGKFVDLCEGPHISSTGELKHFKLLKLAGAYWRGDEKALGGEMLQRIYGTIFPTEEELKRYLNFLDEVEKRDHRRLGVELDLFSFHEEAGAGLPIYHPKGAIIREKLIEFSREEHLRRGYQPVCTPHIFRTDLWERSGHLENYADNMFFVHLTRDESSTYGIKPMNCPGHCLIYRTKTRSYRELPLMYFEYGNVYRYERKGVLHGLLRVRGFTQDDAHIFCSKDNFQDVVADILDFTFFMMETFGFNYSLGIGTRPDHFIGSEENWDMATQGLIGVAEERNIPYYIKEKDGTFYGPKLDVTLLDSIGREWQGATIQVDFALPERFDLLYMGSDSQHHRPVMIHRAIYGSLERFIGLLIEDFAGAFPTWLAPIQCSVLPITDKQNEAAKTVHQQLQERGIRSHLDDRSEKLGMKIRDGQMQKIPYLLVVGQREAESGNVAVRDYFDGDLGPMLFETFHEKLKSEIASKRYRRR